MEWYLTLPAVNREKNGTGVCAAHLQSSNHTNTGTKGAKCHRRTSEAQWVGWPLTQGGKRPLQSVSKSSEEEKTSRDKTGGCDSDIHRYLTSNGLKAPHEAPPASTNQPETNPAARRGLGRRVTRGAFNLIVYLHRCCSLGWIPPPENSPIPKGPGGHRAPEGPVGCVVLLSGHSATAVVQVNGMKANEQTQVSGT